MDDRLVLTKESNYRAIAGALRLQLDCSDSFAPGEMAAAVMAIPPAGAALEGVTGDEEIDADGHWIRPAGCPDLSAVSIDYANDEEVVYLTYDNTGAGRGTGWASLVFGFAAKQGVVEVSRGTVSNGGFTAVAAQSTEPATGSGMGSPRYVYDYYGSDSASYVVYRVKPTTGHLSHFFFAQINTTTATELGLAGYVNPSDQCCVERVGNLPWLTSLQGSTSNEKASYRWGCAWLRRDAVAVGSESRLASMLYAWSYCYRLVELDFSRWDTSAWTVNSLSYAFHNCFSLRKLDLTGWDTSNWAVGSLSNAWGRCLSLRSLDVSTWDTSNWTVTSLGAAWAYCASLRELDLSAWDTSNWRPTVMNSAWANCYSLNRLNISTWDVSDWPMDGANTLYSTWAYCTSLRELDLSKWDVEGWRPANMNICWQYCYNLRAIDLSKWKTSSWAISGTGLGNAFRSCSSLRLLKLGTISLAGMNSTASNYSNMFEQCCALVELDGITGLHESVSLATSQLTRASAVSLFNSLPTVTGSQSITLCAVTYAQLSAADLAIATNKGWTVANP